MASTMDALITGRAEAALSRERTVHPTAMPLTCRVPSFAESAADEVRDARGASAPGQRTHAVWCSGLLDGFSATYPQALCY
jgi:hypothetical protein